MPNHRTPAIDQRMHRDPVALCLSRLKENPGRQTVLLKGSPMEMIIGYITKGGLLPPIENDDSEYESDQTGYYALKYQTNETVDGTTTKRPVWLFLGDAICTASEIRAQIRRGATGATKYAITEDMRFAFLTPRSR